MISMIKRILGTLVLMSLGFNAQAGHLFSQAGPSTSIDLTAGEGIDIPQASLQSAGMATFELEVTGFDSGDILRLTIGSEVRVFDFDAMPAGYTSDSNSINHVSDPAWAALNLSAPFTWRVDALAGAFTLDGAVIPVAAGFRIIGTDIVPGSVIQSAVNAAAATASSTENVPIFSPIQLMLLIFGLIGVAGVWQRRVCKT